MIIKKYGKCEKCGKEALLEITYYQERGKNNAYFVCKECRQKREEELERIRQNYRTQFGENWH